MSDRPIGLFDSGVGGLSIWSEIVKLLPAENTIYLADSKNAPYGDRTAEEIIALSVKNTEHLLKEDCKLIVVACNTATTNAIDFLRAKYSIPFIGIEPAIKPAALKSQTKKVGVLATRGTLASSLFHHTATNHAAGIKIIEQEGKGLVGLIESGKANATETEEYLRQLLRPMIDKGIDYLVLGCTHYPFLMPALKKILPEDVTILDCGEAIARQTQNVLMNHNLLHKGKHSYHRILGNGDPALLKHFTDMLPGVKVVHYMDF